MGALNRRVSPASSPLLRAFAASVLVGDFVYSRAFQMMVEADDMRVKLLFDLAYVSSLERFSTFIKMELLVLFGVVTLVLVLPPAVAEPGEDARRDRDRQRVVSGGPDEVLDHLAVRGVDVLLAALHRGLAHAAVVALVQPRLRHHPGAADAEHVVERGAGSELGILESAREPPVVALRPLAIDDHAQLLFEGKLIPGRRVHEFSNRVRHAREPKLVQLRQCLFDGRQCRFSFRS